MEQTEGNIQQLLNQGLRQEKQVSALKNLVNPSSVGIPENPEKSSDTAATMGLDIASIFPENAHSILNRNDLNARITSNTITVYPAKNSSFHAKKRDKKSEENLKKKSYKGTISKATRNKLKTKLDTWITLVQAFNTEPRNRYKRKKTYITFVTLTLAEQQTKTDKEITNNCLSRFIEKIKYTHGVENYFWRAEKQENGNIHYHILCDTYIEKNELQKTWNAILKKNRMLNKFAKKFKHFNPPSTNIKALPVAKSAKNYLTKYALKTDNEQKVEGRVWYCSRPISNLQPVTFTNSLIIRDIINYILSNYNIKVHETDYSFTIPLYQNELFSTNKGFPFKIQLEYLLLLYHLLYRQRHENDANYHYKQKTKLNSIKLNHIYQDETKNAINQQLIINYKN